MTASFDEVEARMRAAFAELDRAVARTRQDLARFERENQPTPEQLRELQEAARSGELGFDMQELARLVDEDRDDWMAIFSGDSPNSVLLRGHLEREIEANRDAVRAALEEDPEFPDERP
jgi:hypothetical protein